MKAALVAGTCLALLGGSASATTPSVTVKIEPAEITRRAFDPRNPPAEMPRLTPPEVGTCVYSFSCTSETEIRGGRGRPARVTSIGVTTHLKITLWAPAAGPPKILAHEEGHRAICEVYYGPAESIARQLALREVGQMLHASVDHRSAAQGELKAIQSHILAAFLEATATRCDVAQKRFDALTDHSRNPISESTAIKQALAEEKTAYASARAAEAEMPVAHTSVNPRSPPTRPFH